MDTWIKMIQMKRYIMQKEGKNDYSVWLTKEHTDDKEVMIYRNVYIAALHVCRTLNQELAEGGDEYRNLIRSRMKHRK